MIVLSEEKRSEKEDHPSKREIVPVKPRRRSTSMLQPYRPMPLWEEFDRAFGRFRRDFEQLFWPAERLFGGVTPAMRELETTVPIVDLEDKGNELVLTAEVPGFKKDDIEIQVEDDAVEISGTKSSKHDERTKGYVQKERSSESFYRRIPLPEEIKANVAEANLKDGLLELVLPKKTPKSRRKIPIK